MKVEKATMRMMPIVKATGNSEAGILPKQELLVGPFPETGELTAGFWLWQVTSMECGDEAADPSGVPLGQEDSTLPPEKLDQIPRVVLDNQIRALARSSGEGSQDDLDAAVSEHPKQILVVLHHDSNLEHLMDKQGALCAGCGVGWR